VSGLAGVWNLDGRPLDQALLVAISATLRHRGTDGEQRWAFDSVGFAHQHTWITPEEVGERQPVRSLHAVAVFDGRLDNRAELLRALARPKTSSDAQLILAAYDSWGDRLTEHLVGEFALAVYDLRRRRLVMARDVLGLRPVYYFRTDRLFVFASEIKAILAHPDVPVRPDDEGLADFVLVASRLIDQTSTTCFAGIKALEPAHVAVVEPHRFVTSRYWDFDPSRSIALGSLGEYAEAFREVFEEAVRRRLRSAYPVAISVSGGLDSSSIFCQATRLMRSGQVACPALVGVSYGGADGSGADERQYVTEIERLYGVPVEQFVAEPLVGLVEHLDEQIAATEAPFVDYLWGVTRELHVRVAASGARVLVTGNWGDQIFFSSAYLVDLCHRLAWKGVLQHLREFERWFGSVEARVLARRFVIDLARHHLPRRLVPPLKWVRRRVFGVERSKAWFADGFLARALRMANRPATLGDGFHSAQARAIYLEARSKYHVHCIEWHNKVDALHGLDAGLPVLDRDLLAFMMAIPGEVQNPGGVPRGLLREAMRDVLPEKIRTRRSKGDFTGLVNAGITQDTPAIRRALSSDAPGVRLGYLDVARLSPAVERLSGASRTSNDCADSWDLADLLGFDAWLRIFLKPRAQAAPVSCSVQESV
jgi:asparagine synthase (glutamine-hydrolysing)